METLEPKSQLNNQQHSQQSDLSSHNTDEIVSSLSHELETLVISNSYDRDLEAHSDDSEQDPNQCWGLEHQKLGQSDDFKEKDEVEFVDDGISSEIRVYESNGDEWGFDDYQHRFTDDNDGTMKSYHYPVRPDAEDCSYYMRTGMCKYGSNCKFNHPLGRKNQPTMEFKKHREDNMERHGQPIECKYYLSSAGCKFGKACKYNHTRVKTAIAPVVEYNFLGLPIRLGEKECPYYMRNGSCKYGPNCRFNHPDPTAVGGGDVQTHGPTMYGNDGPVVLQSPTQPSMPSWSAPRTPDPNAAFVPMMYSPNQNMPPPNSDWNGYQAAAHVYPSSERGLPIPPAFFLDNPPSDTNVYTHHQQQMLVSDYPERPGQPECSYFMKTGDCKYRSTCKFHHPKSRSTRNAPSVLSDKGLPLRPDQSICSHYSRYGICKYGPACKYDHPVNYSNSRSSGEGYRSDGPRIQQSV
ncbi:zinc finger CCCH domain-containing protein 67-like isoform X2 [Rutidosis leptorrhynchoides]|uniref:zinc finger CCCH domain-containing protein 67-like isoform X2 n=1 Tax=Rutidosis leptorrhynchoides TaxID=125765 RepID=UPI003A9976D4